DRRRGAHSGGARARRAPGPAAGRRVRRRRDRGRGRLRPHRPPHGLRRPVRRGFPQPEAIPSDFMIWAAWSFTDWALAAAVVKSREVAAVEASLQADFIASRPDLAAARLSLVTPLGK